MVVSQLSSFAMAEFQKTTATAARNGSASNQYGTLSSKTRILPNAATGPRVDTKAASRGICAGLTGVSRRESHETPGRKMARELGGGVETRDRVQRRLKRLPGAERGSKMPFGLVEAHHLDFGGEPLHHEMDRRRVEIERRKRGIVAIEHGTPNDVDRIGYA